MHITYKDGCWVGLESKRIESRVVEKMHPSPNISRVCPSPKDKETGDKKECYKKVKKFPISLMQIIYLLVFAAFPSRFFTDYKMEA